MGAGPNTVRARCCSRWVGWPEEWCSVSVLERQFLAYLTCRHRLPFDTRYSARAGGKAEPWSSPCAMEGTFTIAGAVRPARCRCSCGRRDQARRSSSATSAPMDRGWRSRTSSVEVRTCVARRAHGPVAVGEQTLDAARRLVDDIDRGTVGPASFVALLDALGAAGVITPGLASTIVDPEPERFERLWTAVRPLYAEFTTSASIRTSRVASGCPTAPALPRRQRSPDVQHAGAALPRARVHAPAARGRDATRRSRGFPRSSGAGNGPRWVARSAMRSCRRRVTSGRRCARSDESRLHCPAAVVLIEPPWCRRSWRQPAPDGRFALAMRYLLLCSRQPHAARRRSAAMVSMRRSSRSRAPT